MTTNLLALKTAIEEKAIQKFPFTLNNETYFSSECYYENTIINGISLQVKQARGISNEEQLVGYLVYSNRLIFYAGANILTYNTYKRKYEIICEAYGMLGLKATSLSTVEKEYVMWVDRIYHEGLVLEDEAKVGFQFCVYDMMAKQKIYKQQFHTLKQDLKPNQIEIIAFMHPIKVIGVLISDEHKNESRLIYKKAVKNVQQAEFGDQMQLTFPFLFKKLKYDLESNSYFFMKNQEQIWALQISCDKFAQDPHRVIDNSVIEVEKVLFLKSNKKLGERKLIDFALSETYLLLLTVNQNKDREFQFYSLFSYGFIFNQTIWTPPLNVKPKNKSKFQQDLSNKQIQAQEPIDWIEFNKNIIIGLRNNSCEISIYSINEQALRHIRDSTLDLTNCHGIEKVFINPFSSQAMVLSRHYQLEGMITTEHKSSKIIRRSETKSKKFYLEVSSFFITAETSIISVSKMQLQKQNHISILTAPWLSEFYLHTDYLIKSKRWAEKFDVAIKCSAIHPTGQYIALGFNDSFKIYFLTHEGLTPTYVMENMKECTSVAYSKSGNDFAAATSTTIFIYDCYSYQKKHQVCLGISYRIQQIFYTHCTDRNRIKQSLQCITSTKRIVSYNADQGYRQQFSFNPKSHVQNNLIDGIMSLMQNRLDKLNHNNFMDTTTKTNQVGIGRGNDNNNQNIGNKKVSAVFYDEKVGIVIFSIGNKIYFINCVNFQSLGCFDFDEITCIQICRSINTLFFGTATGIIIAFPWPNKPINITSRIPIFKSHRGRIKKIKVSSNLFELISITDESMYIHSLTVVHEMRKIQKYELQREYNNKSLLAMNFYLRAGFCLMTHEKFQQKCEEIKQFEQQAVNMNFMMPEEREKQKVNMLNKLEDERQKISMDTQENGMPLKIQALNAKDKIKGLQKQIKINLMNYENAIEKEKQSYRRILSQLSFEKDELLQKEVQIKRRLQKQVNDLKLELKKDIIKAETVYRIKLDEVNRKANQADFERKKNLNNFRQLDEMDKEKQELSRNIIQHIEREITALHQRNGYLSCRNTNIEKDLQTKRRKIEDIKQLIQNTTQSIQSLPRKAKRERKPEDIKQQQTINKQFAETERKYLKQTKKLIQKNKAVNVSIELYEKEREMLVILDREREKQERNIDGILQYIMKEREQRQIINSKVAQVKTRAKNILGVYQAKNAQRIRAKNILKEYLFQMNLFQEGVTSLEELKRLSQIAPEDMMGPPENLHLSIDEKKVRINKIENTEQKIMNMMKNQRKIYSNEKRKTCLHNQDLLVNFNFLLHQNKHLINVMKDLKEKRKFCIKNMNSQRNNHRVMTKPTPFETYVNFRSSRRLKTTPCAEYDFSR